MLAIVEAYQAGLLKAKHWLPNITAGLIVGTIAIPLAMAFSIASGAKPEQGLYTAIIAALFVAIFGGSRVQIAGPTGAFVVILASITARFGIDGLQVASLLAGIMLMMMGFLRLGNIIKYIPDPVIVGFTSGIGVIIFVGAWKDFLGLSVHIPIHAHFHSQFFQLIQAIPTFNIPTASLGILSLMLIIFSTRIIKAIPGPIIAMLIVTTLQALIGFKDVATIGSVFGGITSGLPAIQLPAISLNRIIELIGPAFTIALLGALESLLSAAAADGMAGTRHHSNQELIGQGMANIMAPLFGGFAATGAIARTATNIRYGGNSPLAAIVHSIFLILVLLLLAPLAAYIPLCTLAAILFVVAYNMSDIPRFIHILKRAPRHDVIVLLITFILTIFVNLVVAVNIGVILATLFFVSHMSESVDVEQQTNALLEEELKKNGLQHLPKDTLVYTIQGPFFFGAAEKLEQALAITHTDPKRIIFRLNAVPLIDMTGLETFQELIEEYYKRGVKVYLCEAKQDIIKKLDSVGILKRVEGGRCFYHLSDILQSSHFRK